MNDAGAMQTRMSELARKFVFRTRDDVARMREALAGLDGGTGGGLELIRQLAHRACGTGGTVGLDRVSDAAGNLERMIDAMPGGGLPDDAARRRIAAGLDALAAELEHS